MIAVPPKPGRLRRFIPFHNSRVLDMSITEKYIGASIVPGGQMIAIVFVGLIYHGLVAFDGGKDVSILSDPQPGIIARDDHIARHPDFRLPHRCGCASEATHA